MVRVRGEGLDTKRLGARVRAKDSAARKDLLPDPSTKLFENWSDGTPENHARIGRSLRKILIIFLETLQISAEEISPRRAMRAHLCNEFPTVAKIYDTAASRVRRLLPRVAKLDHNQEKADYPLRSDSVKLAAQYDRLIQISRETCEIMSFRRFTQVLLCFKISIIGAIDNLKNCL